MKSHPCDWPRRPCSECERGMDLPAEPARQPFKLDRAGLAAIKQRMCDTCDHDALIVVGCIEQIYDELERERRAVKFSKDRIVEMAAKISHARKICRDIEPFVRHDVRCVHEPPTRSMDCDCGARPALAAFNEFIGKAAP